VATSLLRATVVTEAGGCATWYDPILYMDVRRGSVLNAGVYT
jgi:hypothetical protein